MPGGHAPGQHVLRADPQHHDDAREHQEDATAVSTARARVEIARGREGALDRAAKRAAASCSSVKACSVRIAPISSAA